MLGALLGLGLAGCSRDAAPDERPPRDVLLVVFDTLRHDRLGAYGHTAPTSPTLDALAAEGLVVEGAYAQAPWTKPSVASMFTSVLPSAHGVHVEDTTNRLADALVTLPELLQQAGWRTGAFVENPHVQPETGFGQGFDEFESLRGFRSNSAWVVERACGWLDALAPTERFFLYLHFIDPHGPYEPAPDLRARFVGERTSERPAVRAGRVSRILPDDGQGSDVPPDEADLDYLLALYDAEIRGVDDALGVVLARLAELGRRDEAIVVFTSDHPEEFLEHGRLRHGYQSYDVNVRIPLVVRVPGAAPRRESEALVQHVDFAPTILDLLGLEMPAQFVGQSFAPLAWGRPIESRPVLSETRWRAVEHVGLRVGRWRLVHDWVADRIELYDLAADPGETTDVAAEHPGVVEKMLALEAELRRPPADGVLEGATGPGDARLDDALRGLGYTGGK